MNDLNFDYVAINDSKVKKLKITNLNPVNLTIETVQKQQLDDLNIFIESIVDKHGNSIPLPSNVELENNMVSILGPKKTKKAIHFII